MVPVVSVPQTLLSRMLHVVKGEVQSRITINSKERIKISLQIGLIRNKEVVTFWNFTFFTFLDQSFEQMSEFDVSPHNFLHISFTKMTKISFVWECKPGPKIKEIMFILNILMICFYLYLENFQNFMYNIYQIVRRWHHQLSLNIHKDWSRNVFRKNVKFQNDFLSDFHNFCL